MELTKVAVRVGFRGTSRQEMAGFFADEQIEEVRRVFVCLIG
jgi:hypothetical protein